MSFDTLTHTLTAAVATSGNFTVSYPANRDDGDYRGGYDHILIANGGVFKATAGDISLAFGASNITVTYNGTTTLPAGTDVRVQLDRVGADDSIADPLADSGKMARVEVVTVNLGAPLTADPDGILDGVTATDSAAEYDSDDANVSFTLDVPRNLTAVASAGANHVVTVTGLDAYGQTIVEQLTLTADTPVAGKKAFKSITLVQVAAGAAGDTMDLGWGDVLGLPVFLPEAGLVLAEIEDGAKATAGTVVAGVSTAATATTGDVRGTYDPNSAMDGAKDIQLVIAVPDPSYKGVAQYAG